MKRWLAFDIGCIECGEGSEVIGVYPTQEAAEAAASAYANPPDRGSWGRPEWIGQHSCEVFEIEIDESNTRTPPEER